MYGTVSADDPPVFTVREGGQGERDTLLHVNHDPEGGAPNQRCRLHAFTVLTLMALTVLPPPTPTTGVGWTRQRCS